MAIQFIGDLSRPSRTEKVLDVVANSLQQWLVDKQRRAHEQQVAQALIPRLVGLTEKDRATILADLSKEQPGLAAMVGAGLRGAPISEWDRIALQEAQRRDAALNEQTGWNPREDFNGPEHLRRDSPGPRPAGFFDAAGPVERANQKWARSAISLPQQALIPGYYSGLQLGELPPPVQEQGIRVGSGIDPTGNVALQERTQKEVAQLQDATNRRNQDVNWMSAQLRAEVDREALELNREKLRQDVETAKQALSPADRQAIEIAARAVEAASKQLADHRGRVVTANRTRFNPAAAQAEEDRLRNQLNVANIRLEELKQRAIENAARTGVQLFPPGGANTSPVPQEFVRTAVGPNGQRIGQLADGRWIDVATGQPVQ